MINQVFNDKLTYNPKEKTLISIRDGIQEYLGLEFNDEFQKEYNLTPSKRYKVYRSPQTLEDISKGLDGIPLTNEHIDITDIKEDLIKGKILTTEVIDSVDTTTKSTKAVKNQVSMLEDMLKLYQSGKSELSLGYTAKLIPNETYDFEQVEIIPHHLALVQNGRCGNTCKILDKGIDVILLNEDGTLNQDNINMALDEMSKVIEIMSDEEKAKLFEVLGGLIPTEKVEDKEEPKEKMEDEKEDKKTDEEMKDEAIGSFKDSSEFQTMLDTHAHAMAGAIEKAKNYIENYEPKGKDLDTIMKDTLAKAKPETEFKDCQIEVAFMMLDSKPTEIVTEVKDEKPSKWQEIKEKD